MNDRRNLESNVTKKFKKVKGKQENTNINRRKSKTSEKNDRCNEIEYL